MYTYTYIHTYMYADADADDSGKSRRNTPKRLWRDPLWIQLDSILSSTIPLFVGIYNYFKRKVLCPYLCCLYGGRAGEMARGAGGAVMGGTRLRCGRTFSVCGFTLIIPLTGRLENSPWHNQPTVSGSRPDSSLDWSPAAHSIRRGTFDGWLLASRSPDEWEFVWTFGCLSRHPCL